MVTTPRSVRVQWLAPSLLNGSNVTKYIVSWKMNSESKQNETEFPPPEYPEMISGPLYLDISALKPHSNYTFSVIVFYYSISQSKLTKGLQVRAQSDSGLSGYSEPVTVETYPDPGLLSLVNSTKSSITLKWISKKSSDIQR